MAPIPCNVQRAEERTSMYTSALSSQFYRQEVPTRCDIVLKKTCNAQAVYALAFFDCVFLMAFAPFRASAQERDEYIPKVRIVAGGQNLAPDHLIRCCVVLHS